MLKLHVFLVDTGIMFTFDMEMALESVGKLMEAVFMATQVPVSKQVLMVSNGEPLNPSSRVASYKSAGTETNPIFLFSKSAIESPQPPISSSPINSEITLEQQVEKCLQMPPTIETLVARANLAAEFHLSARELGSTCENLIGDQQLQQQGWQAVVSNLENINTALTNHASVFQEQYQKFLVTREQYLEMLERFDDVISLLNRIPVLLCLTKQLDSEEMCLLDWINSKEQKTSLETLVCQCKDLLLQFDNQVLGNLMIEVNKVLECSKNKGMKEIKGLDERLVSLQQRLILAQQLVQEQAEMAQGFKQNQMRAEYIGDSSVLPDLCASHRKQLIVLAKNHRQLRDICALCTRAKDELSANLHARLRWVMVVEHSICNCDSKLLVLHESLKKIKRRLEVLEQVYEAPRMYVLAVLEILRRKSFSAQFLEWGRSVALSSSEARSEEIDKRNKFSKVFGNHFLHSLFTGLEEMPSHFAESPPSIFDEMLPDLDVKDIRVLQDEVPELLIELSLGESLEQSLYIRERLSQTNLTKLCDPSSNPKLGETLRLRELTGNNSISKMTVSQLQKEISQEDMPIDIKQKPIDWRIDDINMGISSGDFQPSSLKTLPSELDGLQSSQSSEVSDSMFRSAEGLEEARHDDPVEVVGVLELVEGVTQHTNELGPDVIRVELPVNISEPLDGSQRHISDTESVISGKQTFTREKKADLGVEEPLPQTLKSKFVFLLDSIKQLHVDRHELRTQAIATQNEWKFLLNSLTNGVSSLLSNITYDFLKYKEEKESLEMEMFDERKSHKIVVDKMVRDFEQKEISLKEDFEQQMQNVEMKLKAEKQIVIKSENERQESSNELKRELENVREESRGLFEKKNSLLAEIDRMKRNFESTEENLKSTIAVLEDERSCLSKAISNATAEVESLRKENNELDLALNRSRTEKEEAEREQLDKLKLLVIEIAKKDKIIEQFEVNKENLNSALVSKIKKLEADKENLIQKCQNELTECRDNFERLIEEKRNEKEREIDELARKFEFERTELHAKFEDEKLQLTTELNQKILESIKAFDIEKFELLENFEKEKSNLKESLCSEKLKLVEDFKKQRLNLKDDFEKEKLDFKEKLEKEKSSIILSCELEKQKLAEEYEKQQSLSKTSSIEEGIDALEWDRLLQKINDLEAENKALKAERESEGCFESKEEIENMKKTILEKDNELQILKGKMKNLQVFLDNPSSSENQEKISFRQFKVNDLVMLCYDEQRSNYTVLTSEDTKYFLHPDSKNSLNLDTDNPTQIREWLLVYISDQEYCVAKKVQNRFKLPVGTYFYRIRARPWGP